MTELTQEQRDKILARVRKMMALADNAGASEGERENAMRMAHATLAKYNLEMAEATKEQDRNQRSKANRWEVSEIFLHYCALTLIRLWDQGKLKT